MRENDPHDLTDDELDELAQLSLLLAIFGLSDCDDCRVRPDGIEPPYPEGPDLQSGAIASLPRTRGVNGGDRTRGLRIHSPALYG